MPDFSPSILVVDDTRFSAAVIQRTLSQAGYGQVRQAASARAALDSLAEEPAHIVLADWLMPEMDGLELTRQIRNQDHGRGHYTYVILMTGKDGPEAFSHAFAQGVDDFISKSAIQEQFLPKLTAACRMALHLQEQRSRRDNMLQQLEFLQQNSLQDPVTQLGNIRSLELTLERNLRHLESRGGQLALLLFRIDNMPDESTTNSQDLLLEVSRRLNRLVRPLDFLARTADNEFVLAALMDSSSLFTAQSFSRLHNALNLHPLQTINGPVQLEVATALLAFAASSIPGDAQHILQLLREGLEQDNDHRRIRHIQPAPATP